MSHDLNNIEEKVIDEIHNFCENICTASTCAEDDCCLYRIEKIIFRNDHYE
jgi:hypothetical protein